MKTEECKNCEFWSASHYRISKSRIKVLGCEKDVIENIMTCEIREHHENLDCLLYGYCHRYPIDRRLPETNTGGICGEWNAKKKEAK